MTDEEPNFGPEATPEQVIPIEGIEKQYEINPELVKQLENSKLDVESKVALLLVKTKLKPSSSITLTVRNGENIFLTQEELKNVESLIQQLGLAFEIGEKQVETYEYQGPETGEKQSRVLEMVDVLVSQSEEELKKLKKVIKRLPGLKKVEKGEYSQEQRNQDYKDLGESYGYPPTAVEGFVRYMEGNKEARIENSELPEKIRKSDAVIFARLFFGFSREHWQEELKQGKDWADKIKFLSPKIYEEVMDAAENSEEFNEKEKR